MATIINHEHIPIDPARPPVRVSFGRDDNGCWTAGVELSGVAPVTAAALMIEAAEAALTEAGAPEGLRALVTAIYASLWPHVPPQDRGPEAVPGQPCPGCGGTH